ncbi:MAG TPA: hypothetical protein VGC41_04280, partial [Kofleriaceae bacterium]
MSDAKKTGSRDISELKQRLGLKKGAAAPATTSQTRANGAPSGGVVPPPGMNLPPPPGLVPPQPAAPPQPVIPNAADDPFGAMNAMAAQHIPQRAPEIVIVNDGKPVENVGAQSTGSTIVKIAVPAVIALVIGITVGKVGQSASSYNDGLKGAKAILGDKTTASSVAFLKKELSDLDTALDEAKTKHSFKPDLELDKKLKDAAQKLDVKSELVFRAKQNSLDSETSGQILAFYAGVQEVKDMIDQHNKAALGDDMSLKKGKEAADKTDGDAVGGQFKYGVLIQSPTEQEHVEFGAKVVVLSGVYCGGGSPVAKCPDGEQPTA